MRDLYMKSGDGFMLVFSIASSSSFEELISLRDEICRLKDDYNVPIVIVGNKADLEEQRGVPKARAFAVSHHWGAPYYEASARTRSMCNPPRIMRLEGAGTAWRRQRTHVPGCVGIAIRPNCLTS